MRVFRCSSVIAVAVLIVVTMLGSGCAAPPAPPLPPPQPEPNKAPVISSITANPAEVIYGDSSSLTCIATDPDDDPITYSWSASEGTLTGKGSEVTWTAPNKEGNFSITISLKDNRGGQTTGNVMVAVSPPIRTITIKTVPTETGTVDQKNATDYTRTKAGDDAQNVGYRAFWSFDTSDLAGKNIQKASLIFTTGNIIGEPFWYGPATGLGGLWLWKTTHGSKLPVFGYVGSAFAGTGVMYKPPTVVDVTTEIRLLTSYDVTRFQVEALFDRVTNGNNVAEWIEWSSVVLEVTYSVK